MPPPTNERTRTWALLVMIGILCLPASPVRAEKAASAGQHVIANVFKVDARVALASLIAVTDAHLVKLADSLSTLAASDTGRSGEWEQIRGPLADVAKQNVPAVLWFTLPDGSYSTLQSGLMKETLADRAYFPRVMAGQKVLGDLVVSKSTGKSSAIVAVPVRGSDGSIVGALGASVYLDRLSLMIGRSMDIDESMIFYAFDTQPLLAIVWDPGLIMVNPNKLGEVVGKAFSEMLTRNDGTVTYVFRGKKRVVIYRKSPVTGWRYAFGILPEVRPPAGSRANRSVSKAGQEKHRTARITSIAR